MTAYVAPNAKRDSPDSALRRFRQKVVRNIYWGATIGSVVLAAVQGWIGHHGLAGLLGVASILFIWAALQSRHRLLPQKYHAVFVIVTCIAVNYSIIENGIKGLYWAYPVMSSLFFLFNRRLTLIVIPVVYGSFVVSSYLALSFTHSWRFAVSLAMILVLGGTFIVLLQRLQKSMTELVVTDPLTGLYNRNRVTQTLIENIQQKERYKRPASLIMIDLDHFKSLNDEHGHLFGDQMLKQTAKRLLGAIRATDTLFRVGGEEFLVVLPNTSSQDANVAAKKLIKVIGSRPFEGKGATVFITASAGVSELQPGQAWSQWLSRADQALFEAKNNGRNNVVLQSDTTSDAGNPSNKDD
ncbi:diguanylate cyclase (GGDEF) domain-containing protein [Pseudidiomarina planktonica]|uniref:diguanylate cyclase n=1 Tax=Pseudidiomarina planktonica TaxID=1323738 RepID=A0A1Y6E6X2_9GAMM|nr:GGDEF domain-containing protein [Pseudidiomarina planktonica]RUO66377.1 GGDEF domain-containing protein [Pseudidiomarina planktonica]SMQ58446.1 diguanylate cyclase (GGDEF) domain-containing protein [Pseudidiomarina planktonica]